MRVTAGLQTTSHVLREAGRHKGSFLFFAAVFALLLNAAHCLGADISFEATVDRNVISLGDSTRLNLKIYGAEDTVPPELPEIDAFKTRYIGPSSSISVINGKISRSITHVYTLVPFETGAFRIGPFVLDYEGKRYTSNIINIEVVKERSAAAGIAKQKKHTIRSEEDIENNIYLTMEVPRDAVYVNEIIPVTLKLHVSKMGLKDIQYPRISHDGFSMGKYERPRQYLRRDYNDNLFNVIEFKTDLFGTRPGRFTLGPAELDAVRITRARRRRRFRSIDSFLNDDFPDRYETHPIKLKSTAMAITVLPFPEEGRPKSFNGTIGNFNFELGAEPREVKVGDPITLTMRVKGSGNFDTVTSPTIEAEKGFKIYEPTVVKQNRGEKIFEQIIVPTEDTVNLIPKISLSFFNPARKIYQVISRGHMPIKVTKPEKKEELKIIDFPKGVPQTFVQERLGKDIVYIKNLPGSLRIKDAYLYNNKGFLLLHLVPFLLLLSLFTAHKRNERLRTDIRYARLASAPKRARTGLGRAQRLLHADRTKEFCDTVFKTLQEYLGDRYQIASGSITADIVDTVLKRKGLNEYMLNKLESVFRDCDMTRYATSEFDKARMENMLKDLKEVIAYLERQKS